MRLRDRQTDARQSDPYVLLCFAGDTKPSLVPVCIFLFWPHNLMVHQKDSMRWWENRMTSYSIEAQPSLMYSWKYVNYSITSYRYMYVILFRNQDIEVFFNSSKVHLKVVTWGVLLMCKPAPFRCAGLYNLLPIIWCSYFNKQTNSNMQF